MRAVCVACFGHWQHVPWLHSDWDCAAVEHAEKFSARNIANTLWALAKMMHNPGDAFLNSLGAEAGKKVTDFNAQNHGNTVWAFATLGEKLMHTALLTLIQLVQRQQAMHEMLCACKHHKCCKDMYKYLPQLAELRL